MKASVRVAWTLIPDEPDQWGVINIEVNIVDKV
jgi:hypothetical protein